MSAHVVDGDAQIEKELRDASLWEASASEEEDWGDMDMDQEWPVHIGGEEVRNGETRYEVLLSDRERGTGRWAYIPQIVWETWKRKDGTKETWDTAHISGSDDILKRWKDQSRQRRRRLVKQSHDIELWSDLDILSTDTHHSAQAYEEKLAAALKTKSYELILAEKMAQLKLKHGIEDQDEVSEGEHPRQAGPSSSSTRRHSPHERPGPSKRQRTANSRARSPSEDQLNLMSPTSMHPPSSVASSSVSSRTRSSSTFSTTKGLQRLSTTPASSIRSSTASASFAAPRNAIRKQSSVTTIPDSDEEEDDSRSLTLRSTPARRGRPPVSPQISAKGKGKEKAKVNLCALDCPTDNYQKQAGNWLPEVASSGFRQIRPSSTSSSRLSMKRGQLQRLWNTQAKNVGAKGIVLVNEIDDEEIPPLDPNFRYLENDYIHDIGDKHIPNDQGFFRFCDHKICKRAMTCDCQGGHPLMNGDDPTFPYSEDGEGYFMYAELVNDAPVLVVECNKYCKCGPDCPNRVAQRPRDVPVEIFKTAECGWGVRCPQDVEKGKVLGLYTGKIILRSTAENMEGAEKAYCFDLDGTEDRSEETEMEEERYTVDSRLCGNWTRFLKQVAIYLGYLKSTLIISNSHSCSPNLKVYSAIWQTIPESNLPSLVFYAAEDIPAGTEFTFDYDPAAAKEWQSKEKRKKLKLPMPKGTRECRCRSKDCRGWMV
ncbi:hypothetical protein VNI00_018349 [Paramarasmius palmivorus]|uniref:SET domain-containing protein n=1 Tax=Paramarasmius palmivorus TaxID=297713 RepID=A0AAW0AYM8_9AGAR